MNDEIKLTYLLFTVYLSVLCSLGPFGAILSDFIDDPPPPLGFLGIKNVLFYRLPKASLQLFFD